VSYVEDERVVYGVSLRAAGLDTHACANPAAAIAALPWRPDVVVTRILQPGAPFDGLELTRRIRQHPDTRVAPVIALTSFVGTFQRISSEPGAPDVVLLLPCDPDELLAAIKRVLTRQSQRQITAAPRW
jgi:CheY-like chemotaxis protein